MKKLSVAILFSIISISVYSQTNIDSVRNFLKGNSAHGQNYIDTVNNFTMGNPVPIYEYGAPLTSCETNFHNLFKNWTPANVTNAHEYELLDFSFVENLSDTARYNFYRNYFTGGEVFYSSVSAWGNTSIATKKSKGKIIYYTKESSECFVSLRYVHSELFDQRRLTEKAKKIYSEEFSKQAKELVMREINIDTMKLVYTSGDIYTANKEKSHSESFGKINTIEKGHLTYDLASKDSISPKLFNTLVLNKTNQEELSVQEIRALMLEEILLLRISNQFGFNKLVHLGDKVYVVRFKYQGTIYKDYFICNPETKKVVTEYFFKNITIQNKKIIKK